MMQSWKRIIDVFDEVHPDRFIGVDLVMSDYESAIQGSLTAALLGSQAVGCFFHYSQAWINLNSSSV